MRAGEFLNTTERTERIIKMYNLRLYVIHFSCLESSVAWWHHLAMLPTRDKDLPWKNHRVLASSSSLNLNFNIWQLWLWSMRIRTFRARIVYIHIDVHTTSNPSMNWEMTMTKKEKNKKTKHFHSYIYNRVHFIPDLFSFKIKQHCKLAWTPHRSLSLSCHLPIIPQQNFIYLY